MARVFSRGMVIGGIGAVAMIGALVWAFAPDPVQVDIATVTQGPMEITVTAEGKTRVRDPWLVTAPITGTTARSPVEVGDTVIGGQTIVAVIEPAAPALLDARTRRQAEAAVIEAQAAVRLAEVELARAEASRTYYAVQLDRNRALAERGTIARRLLEESEQQATTAAAAADEARYNLDLRRATLDRMEAQLSGPESAGSPDGTVPR